MRVNELAQQAKISPHVVRFYARAGLLKPMKNPRNGYKVFGHNELRRVRFIRLAKCLGYSLAEIAELLGCLEQGSSPCELMERTLRERLIDNQARIESLQRTQRLMEQALTRLKQGAWNGADVDELCGQLDQLIADT